MWTERDRQYITTHYRRLEELCVARGVDLARVKTAIAQGALPRPAYRIDGADWVPEDFLDRGLVDTFDPDRVRDRFLADYQRAYQSRYGRCAAAAEAVQAWSDYLSGAYGVCLRHVTPEAIVAKGYLIETIQGLVATPQPDQDEWRAALTEAVDALDALERPFATGDRERFGGLVSRDLYVTAVRTLFPGLDPGRRRT